MARKSASCLQGARRYEPSCMFPHGIGLRPIGSMHLVQSKIYLGLCPRTGPPVFLSSAPALLLRLNGRCLSWRLLKHYGCKCRECGTPIITPSANCSCPFRASGKDTVPLTTQLDSCEFVRDRLLISTSGDLVAFLEASCGSV